MTKFVLASLMLCVAGSAMAGPIVTYELSGTPGNYDLTFTVTNTTPQDLYFFGVLLPTTNILGTPVNWVYYGSTYNPSSAGGPNVNFNDVVGAKGAGTASPLVPGNSFSFIFGDSAAGAPTSVQWMALTCDGIAYPLNPNCGGPAYTGNDNFGNADNPGFSGTIVSPGTVGTTPEPGKFGLIAMGLAGSGLALRRRRI